MNTYKEKALAHVRSVCPELMELSFGCEVHITGEDREHDAKFVYRYWISVHGEEREDCVYKPKFQFGDDMVIRDSEDPTVEIIGHTPHLEHWLRGIDANSTDPSWVISVSSNLMRIEYRDVAGIYNLSADGENQSEEFYQAYCEIVGI